MKNQMTKKLSVALLTGMLTLGSAASFAAETAHGVVEFTNKSYETAKAALDQLKAGDKAAASESIKAVKQYTKEITGDAAGMRLQKANQAIRQAALAIDAGDTAKATEQLTQAVSILEAINKDVKKK